MIKNEENFIVWWEKERKKGIIKYYIKQLGTIFSISMGIFIVSCLATQQFELDYFLISIFVITLFPVISWKVNEMRYNKKTKD